MSHIGTKQTIAIFLHKSLYSTLMIFQINFKNILCVQSIFYWYITVCDTVTCIYGNVPVLFRFSTSMVKLLIYQYLTSIDFKNQSTFKPPAGL